MKTSIISESIKKYFKTTTLHGFKYLCSTHFADRIGWLACCCASACCAGMLCAVLWTRFLEVPALLVLSDDRRSNMYLADRMPAVAMCPPLESVANKFLEKLSPNSSLTKRIPITLARLLAGKSAAQDQLLLLDQLLATNNVTLPQVMMDYTPSCNVHMKKCRYQKKTLPCEQLFEKKLMYWGLCCVMQPIKLSNVSTGLVARSHTTQMLDFVLQCSHGSILHSCQLVTIYEGEMWEEPDILNPGYYYLAQLRFNAIPENPNTDKLVENTCIHDTSYSRTACLLNCVEKACGCRDPLLYEYFNIKNDLPMCTATQLGCLRTNDYKRKGNVSCDCLPSCRKITSFLVIESSPLTVIKETFDPLYALASSRGLNVTPSVVLNLRVNLGHSRVFLLNPTETWLTLLSSLGGVFNMFLGVGLFSALEFLYLMIVKLPIAIRKSSEIDPTATPRVVR